MEHLSRRDNRRIGQALHTYSMLADKDRVMIAVSGGIDSLVLTWLMDQWRHKAPIHYEILAVHLDMGFGDKEAELVAAQLQRLAVPFYIEHTDIGQQALAAEAGKSGCHHCSRRRRNRLFDLAKEKDCNKIAFGHHQEDIIETFFLNLLYSGNMSTMVPRQDLFGGTLSIIRPLAYLDKQDIVTLGEALGVTAVANPCPVAGHSKREEIRALMNSLYRDNPMIKGNIFSALANPKPEYMLTPPGQVKQGVPSHANQS